MGDNVARVPRATNNAAALQPRNLSLEKLHLAFADNVYYAGAAQGLFEWGASWRQHKNYASLAEFQSSLGIDQGSRVQEPGFANQAARDFRIPTSLMENVSQCYPQEPVPGVILGTEP
jgi:hypothetical protein